MCRLRRSNMKANVYITIGTGVLIVLIIYYQRRDGWSAHPREWVYLQDGSRPPNTFTYMTYNILCQGMMTNSTPKIKYEHCGPHFWDLNLRQSRLMKEVEAVDPDIVCLQEMDRRWFDSFWLPGMKSRGYEGVAGLTLVKNRHDAGQAIFWRKTKFKKTFDEWYHFHDLLKAHVQQTSLGQKEAQDLLDFFTRRNLLLLAELQDVTSPGSKLLVGCPHFSHRQKIEPSIQVWQAGVSLRKMKFISKSRGTPAMILSGDLNAPPNHPAYEFIQTGRLTPELKQKVKEYTHWKDIKDEDVRKYVMSVMEMVPSAFEHDVELNSAYPAILGREPLHTYVSGGKTFDYIWMTSQHIGISGILKVPPEIQLKYPEAHCSPHQASDHIPLAAKLFLKPT